MKKRISKIAAIVLAGAMVMGMAACSGSDGSDSSSDSSASTSASTGSNSTSESSGETLNVSAILMALNSDYWNMIKAGLENGAADFGVNLSVTAPTNEADVTGQISMVEDQLTAGADGIVLAPCDTQAILPTLEKCEEAGIPVVLIDMDLEEENQDLRATFIGSSEYAAGEMVGEYIVENYEPCKIAVIRGLAGLPSHDARANGMRDVVTEAGFEVVTEQPADSERGKAVTVCENIMSANPDVGIVYCTNDEMALGAYQAIEGAQLQDSVSVIGFDGSPDGLKSIKDGKLTASLAQMPIEMGYKAVEVISSLNEGGTVEPITYTETVIVDSENVEDFEANLNEQLARAEEATQG